MAEPERVGDYLLYPPFASGGMASIHLGRLTRAGFQRVVVVKRMHPAQASEPGAAERLLREARLSSRIRSPYVIPTIDVIDATSELCLVMDLVHGVTLAKMLELAAQRKEQLPIPIIATIFGDLLRGLHAAHEVVDEEGNPLHVIHRDVTPRNILIGADGMARVLDFGIAKALGHRGNATTGDIRGTLGYMAPELLRGDRAIARQVDIFSAGVMLWEALAGRRWGGVDAPILPNEERLRQPPSKHRPDIPAVVDAVVLHALRMDPSARYATAEAMALDLEEASTRAPREDVVRLMEDLAFDEMEKMRELVRACESPRASNAPSANTPANPTTTPPTAVTRSTGEGTSRSSMRRIGVAALLGAGAMGIVWASARTRRTDAPPADQASAITTTKSATPEPVVTVNPIATPAPPTTPVEPTPVASAATPKAGGGTGVRQKPRGQTGKRTPPTATSAAAAPATPAPPPREVETTPPAAPKPAASNDPAADRM